MARARDMLGVSTLEALRSGRGLAPAEINWLEGRFMPHWRELAGGCWEWTGKRFNVGYGIVYVGARAIQAQRVSFALWHGAVQPGVFICHHCDNRWCVNPEHLFAGTAADNNRDKAAKGRAPKGENHASTRLTDAQVAEIRRRYSAGNPGGNTPQTNSQRELAREFGVGKSQIARIMRGESRV